jgi:hypothetical protein
MDGEPDARVDVSPGKPTIFDQPRKGRESYTNPALIRMSQYLTGLSEEDRGVPARGILIGLGISAALWSVIGLIIWLVARRW